MNEASRGFAGAADGGGHRPPGGQECSPLQTGAAFLKNWSWQSIVGINQRACSRGGSQHGINSETGTPCQIEWEQKHVENCSLLEAFDLLRSFHKKAPFLFLNDNTFSFIGREMSLALFSDLPALRKRELSSAVAHYIAGVLDRESMISAVNSLCESASLIVGDRVETLRGSLSGVIIRILEDGRVAWKPDPSNNEFIGLPESLRKIKKDWGEN